MQSSATYIVELTPHPTQSVNEPGPYNLTYGADYAFGKSAGFSKPLLTMGMVLTGIAIFARHLSRRRRWENPWYRNIKLDRENATRFAEIAGGPVTAHYSALPAQRGTDNSLLEQR